MAAASRQGADTKRCMGGSATSVCVSAVSVNQPQQAVTRQAYPEVYSQPPIELINLVLRALRQELRHAEVDGVARQHGNQGLPERLLDPNSRAGGSGLHKSLGFIGRRLSFSFSHGARDDHFTPG